MFSLRPEPVETQQEARRNKSHMPRLWAWPPSKMGQLSSSHWLTHKLEPLAIPILLWFMSLPLLPGSGLELCLWEQSAPCVGPGPGKRQAVAVHT